MRACCVRSRSVPNTAAEVGTVSVTNECCTDIETSGEETKVRLRWHEHWQARHSSKETEEFQEIIIVPIRTFRVQQVRAESIDLLLTTPTDLFHLRPPSNEVKAPHHANPLIPPLRLSLFLPLAILLPHAGNSAPMLTHVTKPMMVDGCKMLDECWETTRAVHLR